MSAPRRTKARSTHTARWLTTSVLVALGVFVFWQRCDQMRDHADENLDRGLNAWTSALSTETPDLGAAEQAFEEAARHSVSASFPLFCLSAIEEVRGQKTYDVPPSEDWIRAVEALGAGDLETASELFEAREAQNERAALYVRLIDELEQRR